MSTTTTKRRTAHWWTPACTQARKEKNKALGKYKKHVGDLQLWIKYKKVRASFRYTTLQAQRESWMAFLNNFTSRTTSSTVWKQVRMLQRRVHKRSIVLKIGDSLLTQPTDVADSLAQFYASRCGGTSTDPLFQAHKGNMELTPVVFPLENTATYNAPLTIEELNSALSSSNSRSPGPDNIPYTLLHQLTADHRQEHLKFFNYIYSTGYPHQWREGHIVPIPKPGKVATDRSSYRPITLTNCLSKVLGKIANRRLQCFIETASYYSPAQSGFRAAHSTLDALTRLEYDARTALLEGQFCVAVFLDISQAFDSVWHHGLLLKLKSLGLSGNIARLLQQFLLSRRNSVRLNSTVSPCYPASCGVPQGSVLSPTLFTLFINDIFESVPAAVCTSLYADDGALWITARTLQEALTEMQAALDSVTEWSHIWGLTLSLPKTHSLIFTRKRYLPPPALTLHGAHIQYVSTVKFLGLTFDSKLTWKKHIYALKDRCCKDLQLLRVISSKRWGADLTTLRRLYVALILPKLDYGSFLFATACQTSLLELDRVQWEAIRIMTGALRCTPTYKLEPEVDLMPLQFCRRQLLLQYGCRISSVPSHPVRELLNTYFPIQDHLAQTYVLSAVGRLYDEMRLANISPEKIPEITMPQRYQTWALPVHSTLANTLKASWAPKQWQQEFENLVTTKYSDHMHIYTDGSLKEDKCGCGVWSKEYTLVARLPPSATIYTAELYAIYAAIKFSGTRTGPHVIFTDSLSAVTALKASNCTAHYLLMWIAAALTIPPGTNITIEWVPSHMGIHGNEQADKLACTSSSLENTTTVAPSATELRRQIHTFYRTAWNTQWSSLSPATTSFKPQLGSIMYMDLPRQQQVPLTRIRLGVSLLTHGHYFTGSPPEDCTACQTRTTIAHLLIDCSAHEHHRQDLRKACAESGRPFALSTLLDPEFPAVLVAEFLGATDWLRKL
jgi:ribonuclease HI